MLDQGRRRPDGPRRAHRCPRRAAALPRCPRDADVRAQDADGGVRAPAAQADRRHARGKEEAKADFSKVDITNLTLVDTQVMDESVITGNITRVVENICYDELQTLNRGIGHLMGQPDLETVGNPLAPEGIVDRLRRRAEGAEERREDQVPDPEGAEPGLAVEISTASTRPQQAPVGAARRAGCAQARSSIPAAAIGQRAAASAKAEPKQPTPTARSRRDGDVPADVRQRAGADAAVRPADRRPGGAVRRAGRPVSGNAGCRVAGMPAGAAPAAGGGEGSLDFPSIEFGGAGPMVPSRYIPSGPLATTRSGYVPGAPIMADADAGRGALARLQAGESGFDLGAGAVQFSGIPTGMQNVLRDLQESPLGKKANQLESMTIEMVAMLFDFIFETRDLPDGSRRCSRGCRSRCSRPRCSTARSSRARRIRRACWSTRSPRRGWAGRR